MKRRILSMVSAFAVFGLIAAACANNTTTTSGGGTSPSGGSAAPAVQTLTSGVLTIGSCLEYPPFEKVTPGSTRPTGFDIELAEAIAAKLGFDQSHVMWVKQGFNTIFTAVNQQKFDMIAAAVTASGALGRKRAQTVDFSNPYFNATLALTVNTTNSPDVASTDDLKAGDVVGVQSGTTGEDWAKTNLVSKGVQIKSYPGAPQAFTDLEAGNVTGVVNDSPSSAHEVESRPDLEVVQQIDANQVYAFAFAKDNTQLVDAWNTGLKEVIADGTYATIFAKYFPGVPVPPDFQAAG